MEWSIVMPLELSDLIAGKEENFDNISIFLWFMAIFGHFVQQITWKDIKLQQMLSNDVIATSRYYLHQFQHIFECFRNFDFYDFWPYLVMNPPAFVGNWFWTLSLINIITAEVDDHN